jgi:hypothetical protein
MSPRLGSQCPRGSDLRITNYLPTYSFYFQHGAVESIISCCDDHEEERYGKEHADPLGNMSTVTLVLQCREATCGVS